MDTPTRTAALDALTMALVALTEEIMERATLRLPDGRADMLDHAERLLADCADLAALTQALEVVSRR
jgi:hypothetical protein